MPKETSFWQAANYSNKEWVVFLQNGKARIFDQETFQKEQKEQADKHATIRLSDTEYTRDVSKQWIALEVQQGYFMINCVSESDSAKAYTIKNCFEGVNTIWFYPRNGALGYKVSDDDAQRLISIKNKVIGIEGPAYSGIPEGHVIELALGKDGKWHSKRLKDLPYASTLLLKRDEDSFYILTDSKILIYYLQRNHLQEIVGDLPFGGVYPNSMVKDQDGSLLIGMRYLVVKISNPDNDKRKVTILVPDSSFMP